MEMMIFIQTVLAGVFAGLILYYIVISKVKIDSISPKVKEDLKELHRITISKEYSAGKRTETIETVHLNSNSTTIGPFHRSVCHPEPSPKANQEVYESDNLYPSNLYPTISVAVDESPMHYFNDKLTVGSPVVNFKTPTIKEFYTTDTVDSFIDKDYTQPLISNEHAVVIKDDGEMRLTNGAYCYADDRVKLGIKVDESAISALKIEKSERKLLVEVEYK